MPTIIALVAAGVIGYFAIGLAVHALSVWVSPKRYEKWTYKDSWGEHTVNPAPESRAFDLFLWPIALPLTLARSVTGIVSRSKSENLRVRAELEKELAAAKKELDEFMRGAK